MSATAARRISSETPPSSQTITSLIIATSWLDKHRDGIVRPDCRFDQSEGTSSIGCTGPSICLAALPQPIENAEAPLSVLGLRVLHIAIDDLERACQRHTQPPTTSGNRASVSSP